jgi:hypothetical protein
MSCSCSPKRARPPIEADRACCSGSGNALTLPLWVISGRKLIGAGRVGASLAGISPLSVVRRYVAAVCALFVSGIPASLAQQKYAPIVKDPPSGLQISFRHVLRSSRCSARRSLPMSGRISSRPHSGHGPSHTTCGSGGNSLDGPNRATGLVDRSPSRARRTVSPRSRLRGVDDAGQILAIAQLGDRAWARLRLGRVGQYSVDRACHQAGQLMPEARPRTAG